MKKALFIPWDQKKEDQAISDIAMTKEQRIEKMFELIDLCLAINKYEFLKPVYNHDHFIVLKKKNASIPKELAKDIEDIKQLERRRNLGN